MTNRNVCLVLGSNSFSGSCLVDYLLENKFRVIGLYKTKKNKKFLKYKNNKNLKNLTSIQFDIN